MTKSNGFDFGIKSGEVVGLALLGSTSAFSIWSAANPSVFTVSQFSTEQSKKNARLGMNIGLALTGALSAGLYLAYGKKGTLPAVLTGATGLGLYALYEYLLSQTHITNPNEQTMAQQAEAMSIGGQPGSPGISCDSSGCHIDQPGQPGIGSQGGRGGDAYYYQSDAGHYHDFDYNYKVDMGYSDPMINIGYKG